MSFISTTGRVDVKNSKAQYMTVTIDAFDVNAGDKGSIYIGGTKAVADGADNEFRKLVGGKLNINKRTNDVEKILTELTTGDAHIEGVELVGLTSDSYTIELTNGSGVVDTVTFQGAGVAQIIADLDFGATDFGDGKSRFSTVDLNDDRIGGTGPIRDIVGGQFNANDLDELLEAGLQGDENVKILGIEEHEVALQIINGDIKDTVIFYDEPGETTPEVGDAVDMVESPIFNPRNTNSQLVFVDDPDSNALIAIGTSDTGDGREGNLEKNDMQDLANEAPLYADVRAIDQGDTVRIEVNGWGGSKDVIIVADDGDLPAFEPGDFALLA